MVAVLHRRPQLRGDTLPEGIYGENPTPTSPNLIAGLIVLILTCVLCLGIKISARVNAVIVTIKLAIVLFVSWPGCSTSGRRTTPPSCRRPVAGRARGDGVAVGFDIVATAAEETRNPQRDLPRGIIGSLVICTILYVAVSLVVTGMVKYDQLSISAPLAEAFRTVGRPGFATVISVGALAGLTTVMMVPMLGQSRVFFAMSRDRLLPPVFSRVSARTGVPIRVTVTTGVIVSINSALLPLSELAELVNIGTLFTFVLVAMAVLVLRRTRPDLPRSFKVPGVPVVPILSALASFYLMLNLPGVTWVRFVIWMAIGLVVDALYGWRHFRLAPGVTTSG